MTLTPSVGRALHYYPAGSNPAMQSPFAATIAKVWSSTMVNIGFIDENGVAGSATSVRLLSPDVGSEEVQPGEEHCRWPTRL